MAHFLYAEINIVGIILLLLLLHSMKKSKSKDVPIDETIFNYCIIINIFIFLFDTGMWLFDGDPRPELRLANTISTTLYYISNPIICLLWLLYTDIKINESRSGLFKRLPIYSIPLIISTIMSVASPFTSWLFVFDTHYKYMRGPYFWVMAIASLFYLIHSFSASLLDVIRNGWEENKSVNVHLVVFPIGIILASVIQIMFFGLSVIWICATLALTSIYINIQNVEISTDHLTGLYNRRRLDHHLHRRVKLLRKNSLFFTIILDLDDFKGINDRHGHLIGDEALIKMAGILREIAKGNDDFIARMGGDEFVIVGERNNQDEIRQLMDDIGKKTSAFNQTQSTVYSLLPSMGYSVYQSEDTPETFLTSADKDMYENKKIRKRNLCK